MFGVGAVELLIILVLVVCLVGVIAAILRWVRL